MKKFLSIALTVALMLTVLPFGLFAVPTSAATSGYYTYSVINGKASITDCDTSISGNIVIPSTLGGYPVTNIGDYAFSTCDSVKSITVPNSVISIGEGAFSPCESLVKVTVNNGVISIGNGAFAGCYSLTDIIISDTVTSIGRSAFYDCHALMSIRIPCNITRIESQIFYGCSSLAEVTIPISVTEIGRWAFDSCNNIKNVYYEGTSTQKQKISFGLSNNSLTSAKWHYEICDGTIKHIYDDICDTVCNVCNYERDYSHNFIWIVDKQATCRDTGIKHQECSICYIKQNENTVINKSYIHIYDDVCDSDCNVCSGIREAPHSFKWIIDKDATCGHTGVRHQECLLCHVKQNENTVIEVTGKHTYDDVCDNKCNVCEYIRTNIHVFDNICDEKCNFCGLLRDVPDHQYGDDYSCDICKYSKTPDMPILEVVLADIIKLQSVIGCEYSKDGINWQASPEFSSLEPNTEYTFYQRVAESANSFESKVSAGLTVITPNGFKVCYDANGGTNAPDSHIKTEGVTLAISSLKPIRDGYEFIGWATVVGGDVTYDSGDNYINDETVTLYAKWLKICAKCFGNGEIQKQYVCGSCSGTGGKYSSVDCPLCFRGATTTESSCPACMGGYIIVGSTTKRCTSCGGDGSLTLPSTCSNCGGSGTLNYFLGYCSLCGGTGSEYETYTCNTCAGTGSINELDRIEITQLPEKVSFLEGKETLSVVGGIITLFYSNNTNQTIDITPSMVTGFDNTVVGIQTLTVAYGNKAVTYDIEIIAKSVISIELIDNGLKKEYFENKDALDLSGGMVRVQYNNDTYNDIILTENMINGFDNTIVGIQTLTVTYENKTVTYDIEIIKDYTPGDLDGNEQVTDRDAVHLLYHTFLPDLYPVNQDCDFNGDGEINDKDAVHLLYYTFLPDLYPLA